MVATVYFDRDSDPTNPGWCVEDKGGAITPLGATDAESAVQEAANYLGVPIAEIEVERNEPLPPRTDAGVLGNPTATFGRPQAGR